MRKSRLSHYKQDRLIEHFVSGSTALIAAKLCGVNRKTAAFFFLRLREIIALELEAESEIMFGGEIEVDESYFGGRRKGKHARWSVRIFMTCVFWNTRSMRPAPVWICCANTTAVRR
jgi:transposase